MVNSDTVFLLDGGALDSGMRLVRRCLGLVFWRL
jgi:hypothetical protein